MFRSKLISPIKCLQPWTSYRLNSYIRDIKSLNTTISQGLQDKSPDNVIQLLKIVKNFQAQTYESEKFETKDIHKEINESIKQILTHEGVKLDSNLLEQIFKMKFSTLSNIEIIKLFYHQQPNGIIDKTLALIPFRQSLFDGDTKNALLITDMTTGHPNYTEQKDKEFKSGIMKLIGSSIGISLFSKFGIDELITIGLLGQGWTHLSSINTLIITYVINSSFLMTVVRFGRTLMSSGGDYLTWQKGTFYTYWYKHADEMMMCTKIVEADIKLNGGGLSGGEPSQGLIEELCRVNPHTELSLKPGFTRDGKKVRLLDMKDNIEDLKMQAYWMSGGDGFEWVEPDQDPAELIWQYNLKANGKLGNKDTKSLKWAEQLIEPEPTQGKEV